MAAMDKCLRSAQGRRRAPVTSPQGDRRHSVAATRNRSRVGDAPNNFARIKAHLREIVPQRRLAIVIFVFAANPLQTRGIFNVFLREVTEEHRAGQLANVADDGGGVSLDGEGGGFAGAAGHLGLLLVEWQKHLPCSPK
jgi:hypothetical protein